jgi:excisionase family DNA binding protein
MTATTIPLFEEQPAHEPSRQRPTSAPVSRGDEVLLTAAEAADVLKIGRSKLYELMAHGAITSVKLGRCRRFRRSDVDRFICGLTAPAE